MYNDVSAFKSGNNKDNVQVNTGVKEGSGGSEIGMHGSEDVKHNSTNNINGNSDQRSHSDGADLVCLSHLRWGFVYQRPQHLLSRWARGRRVFFVEEPIFGEGDPRLQIVHDDATGVRIVTPMLPHGLDAQAVETAQELLLDTLFANETIREYILWYYTPMALGFSRGLQPLVTVFDCMDELSAFKGAPQSLLDREQELLDRSDVVFTGGASLYEAKKSRHRNIHAFPSSVDAEHFMQARQGQNEPQDQESIPHPRIGFFGVIDERLDIELLRGAAELRPDYHFVMIGPVVKIDPADLPQRDNIHYLGGKDYKELPSYLAGWDVAMMPFARNESTKFISPTKTPEYLAAGRPVVSTSIRDVVTPYGDMGLVRIADTPEEFVAAIDALLEEQSSNGEWNEQVDGYLAGMSWNRTWEKMRALVDASIAARRSAGATA